MSEATPSSLAEPPPRVSRFRRLMRHPIFPLLLLLPLTQALRDYCYPFSHYPMYSNPTPRPLRFQYLADGDQKPLESVKLTGVIPSHIGKKFGYHKKKLIESEDKRAAREHREPRTEEELKPEAGREVLLFLKEQSLLRSKKNQLPDHIKLMEITLTFEDDRFDEKHTVVGELP